MTVCIAALCQEEGKARAVIATDRMVTLGQFMEFEHAVSKMTTAGSAALAMIAGDTLVAKRLVDDTIATSTATDVAGIARELATAYENVRKTHMEERIQRPRGLTLVGFYQAHQQLNPQIVVMLDNQMKDYNLGVEVLLAGVDSSGAHVYTVSNPGGTERLHDIIGHAEIGSGAIHAVQAMVGFGHSATAGYHETVYRTYAAKRRAEVAPGVGRDTDMAVIADTGIHNLTPDELKKLKQIYEEFQQFSGDELRKKLSGFTLGGEGGSRDDGDQQAAA